MFRGTPYIKQLIIIMEEDILNYSLTDMFRETPYIKQLIIIMEEDI